MEREAHEGGVLAAVGLAAVATAGARLTTFRGLHGLDPLWIVLFVAAWLTMSAAAVGFDAKRWLW